MAGTGVFAACMVAPTTTLLGALVAIAAASCWLCACWPPFRLVRTILLLGLVVLLPYFLLVPFIDSSSSPAAPHQPFAIAMGLFVRGMCGLLVSVATISTLRASDLHEALVGLPVPSAVSAILLQIVHQSATLAYETRRVASAIAVRGASTGGITAWRLLSSLPHVWLPRIVQRADRVASAMELRGYCETRLDTHHRPRLNWIDGLALALGLGVLGIAVAARCWSAR
jgi:energy-coupling factor transporter transmembrane protein EcfT